MPEGQVSNDFVMKPRSDSRICILSFLLLIYLVGSGDLLAQPFRVQNGVINGGSNVAHGGPFSVAAASGQTTSGESSGGQFGVQGGESSGTSPFTGTIVPSMVVSTSGPANVLVGWVPMVPGYVLEFTDTLRTPKWFPYPGGSGTNLHQIALGTRQLFFRLKRTGQVTE